jgi:hypothetical protein
MARVNTNTLEGILAASKVAPAVTPEPVVDDSYYTKVLASGKTQAQIDALRGAYDTAEVIRENDPTKTSTVDRVTGKVITTIDPNKRKISGNPKISGDPLLDTTATATLTGQTYTAPDGRIFTDLAAYNCLHSKG